MIIPRYKPPYPLCGVNPSVSSKTVIGSNYIFIVVSLKKAWTFSRVSVIWEALMRTLRHWGGCKVIPLHDDVIKWKHFPRYWPFARGIHRSPVNSPHKGQWRGALMYSLICAWIADWVNNREAGDLRRHRAHYGVTVMNCTDGIRNFLLNHFGLVTPYGHLDLGQHWLR